MRILCADVHLVGKPHHDWKEGFEFMYAFRKLGIRCDIAGPGCDIPETDIPKIAHLYDLIIITENYPRYTGWKWWNWSAIRTPKFFWAIDTHVVDFRDFIRDSQIMYVGFSIDKHRIEYGVPRGMTLNYALSTTHQYYPNPEPKLYNAVFIGNMVTDRRKQLCERFNIQHKTAFGTDYFKTMKQSRICFNNSISNDVNAKFFEIMGSGSFMLTNYNQEIIDLFDKAVESDLRACMYITDEEIGEKIAYYLEHEDEREAIAKRLYDYVWSNQTWESRCKQILQFIGK